MMSIIIYFCLRDERNYILSKLSQYVFPDVRGRLVIIIILIIIVIHNQNTLIMAIK